MAPWLSLLLLLQLKLILNEVHFWLPKLSRSEDIRYLSLHAPLTGEYISLEENVATKAIDDIMLVIYQVPHSVDLTSIQIKFIVVLGVECDISVKIAHYPIDREFGEGKDLHRLVVHQLMRSPDNLPAFVDDVAWLVQQVAFRVDFALP